MGEDLLDLGHGKAGELLVGPDPLLLDEEAVLELLAGVLAEDALQFALPAWVFPAPGVDPAVLPAGDRPFADPCLGGYFSERFVLEPEPESLVTFFGMDACHAMVPQGGIGGCSDRGSRLFHPAA